MGSPFRWPAHLEISKARAEAQGLNISPSPAPPLPPEAA